MNPDFLNKFLKCAARGFSQPPGVFPNHLGFFPTDTGFFPTGSHFHEAAQQMKPKVRNTRYTLHFWPPELSILRSQLGKTPYRLGKTPGGWEIPREVGKTPGRHTSGICSKNRGSQLEFRATVAPIGPCRPGPFRKHLATKAFHLAAVPDASARL